MYFTQCPKCAEIGKDISMDNLCVYKGDSPGDDGHSYCFACHYYEPPDLEDRLKNVISQRQASTHNIGNALNFPSDYSTTLPHHAETWIRGFGITKSEIIQHNIGYSPSLEQLIFPVFDEMKHITMWQGRNMKYGSQIKYQTHGPASTTMYLAGINDNKRNTLIVTEDLLSAIKVGRIYQTMPLWGSSLSLGMAKGLAKRFASLGIWLDRDKTREAVETSLRVSQFLPTYVITSEFDPKQYSTMVIAEMVQAASRRVLFRDELPEEPVDDKMLQKLCKEQDFYAVSKTHPWMSLQQYCGFRNHFDNVKSSEVQGPLDDNNRRYAG